MSSALPSPEHKRAFVQSMFDRIAPHYDRMNRLMTLGMDLRWRRRGFERLSLRVGELVIDLATGTGDFAALASRFGAHSVGVDLALGMLREARRPRPELSIAQGDGVALPFRSGCAARGSDRKGAPSAPRTRCAEPRAAAGVGGRQRRKL